MVAVEPNRVQGDLLSPSSYDEKRSFNSTPEPRGDQVLKDVDAVTAPTGDTCVIQQHHATALHHDLLSVRLILPTPLATPAPVRGALRCGGIDAKSSGARIPIGTVARHEVAPLGFGERAAGQLTGKLEPALRIQGDFGPRPVKANPYMRLVRVDGGGREGPRARVGKHANASACFYIPQLVLARAGLDQEPSVGQHVGHLGFAKNG